MAVQVHNPGFPTLVNGNYSWLGTSCSPRRDPFSLCVNKGGWSLEKLSKLSRVRTSRKDTLDDATIKENVALDYFHAIAATCPDCSVLCVVVS